MKRVWNFSLFVVLLALLSGCEQLNQQLKNVVKEPSVSVQNLSVTGLNLDSVNLLLRLKVSNPNDFKLALAGYDYQIKFNNKELLKGETSEGFSVPAAAASSVDVPLTIGFNQVMDLLNQVGDDNQLNYEVNANMRLDAPVLNLFAINTHKKGDITVPKLPEVSFGELKVKNMSFTEASFELAMSITNPNSFGVNLKDLDYQFSMGGEKWFSGAIEQGVNLAEKQTTTVKIPVSVSIMKMGSSVLNAITKGDFSDYSLDASFVVDSPYPALKNLKVPIHYAP